MHTLRALVPIILFAASMDSSGAETAFVVDGTTQDWAHIRTARITDTPGQPHTRGDGCDPLWRSADIVEWGAAAGADAFYGYIRTAGPLHLGEATNLRIGFLVDADADPATGVQGGTVFSALWLELLKPWGFRTYDQYWEVGLENGKDAKVEFRDYTWGGMSRADDTESGKWAVGPDRRTFEMRLSYAALNAALKMPVPYGPDAHYLVCPFTTRRLGPNRRLVDVGDTFVALPASTPTPHTVLTAAARPRLRVMPAAISPNGDGCYDSCRITLEDVPYPASAETEVRTVEGGALVWHGWLGDGSMQWNGEDNHGNPVAPGAYIVSVKSGAHSYQAQVLVEAVPPLPPTRPFQPAEFPVLMWATCPTGWDNTERAQAYVHAALEDLKRLNVDVAFFVWADEQMHPFILQEARAAGLKAALHLVQVDRAITSGREILEADARTLAQKAVQPYLTDPTVYGYVLGDEPWPQHRDNLRLMARAIAAVDPLRPTMACLNGTGQDAAATFVAAELPVLIHDNYPIATGRPTNPFPQFLTDMADIYKAAQRAGAPAWLTPQTFGSPGEDIPCPTSAEFEAMIYLALGQGIQGIYHFIHHGITTMETAPNGAIRFRPNELYATVAIINHALHNLGPILLRTQPDLAFHVDALPHTTIVSCLREETGQRYLVCVNTDIHAEQTAWILARACNDRAVLRDLLDGSRYSFTTTNARTFAQVPLRPGQGRMLAIEADGQSREIQG